MEVGRKVLRAVQRGSRRWDVYVMLGCFPKEGEALLSLFEVLCFLLCLVPCSQCGSCPCVGDSGSGFRR